MNTAEMKKDPILKYFLVLSPILVLIITKIIVEICTKKIEPQISWLPSFIGYYLTILLMFFIAKKINLVSFKDIFNFSFKPIPKVSWILAGVIFPALIPLNVSILKIGLVPFEYMIYILIFSVINPIFEETFWRGLLAHIPFNRIFIILYSAILFGFSHYLFWHFWFNIPIVTVVTVISTTVMGIMWMWFYQKCKNIIYLIISHFFVDVFNLSVAIYSGIIPAW
ncbi:CPBP family intramembrane glutamic endopeptidase [Dysgonomonas termitidis]|uniref:CPBP family intramembrane glutamic endopeptidase n=1 Tax=Dysgonomonas termitidis TaxID=1516126 RepID=A0ABV9KSZ5_9BACT